LRPSTAVVPGLSAILALAALLWSHRVAAQGTAQDRALSQSLFEQARSLMQSGNYAEACPKLAESHRLDPAGGTLLNLGICYEKAGKLASAWATFDEAAAVARKEGRADREKVARRYIEELRPRLSYVTIQVPAGADVPGLELRLDGRVLSRAAWGTPVPLDGGEHRIEAAAPGKHGAAVSLAITGEAQRKQIEIPKLEDASGGSAPPAPIPSASGPLAAPEPARAQPVPVQPVADTGVTPAASTPDDRSHASQLGAFVRADISGKGRGAVVVPGVSFGLGRYVELAAGALIGSTQGFWAGGSVFLMRGAFKPLVSVGVPVFFADGARPGVQGSLGMQWDPAKHLGFFVLVGVTQFFSVPDGNDKTVFVPAVGMQARL
jgi:hypothetical protein